MDDNQASQQPDLEPTGEVRAADFASITSAAEPQTRLFWD